MRRRVAVAVSGGGRSLANLLKCQERGAGYEIAGVIASRSDCKAVSIARAHDLPLFVADFTPKSIAEVGAKLYTWLAATAIDWIALAGFLKIFPLDPKWRARTVNIHPALLPRFGGPGMYGDHVHAAVLAAGERVSGATVHYVTERYDEGRIIAQIEVPVLEGDNTATLAARVFAAECQLYPSVIARLIAGELPHSDGRSERLVYAGS